MRQFQHYNLSPGNIHGIVNWEFADLAERDAEVVTEQDLNKVCKVGAGTLFWLSSVSPVTWSEMGGGSGTVPSGTGGIFDGGSRLSVDSIYDGGSRL